MDLLGTRQRTIGDDVITDLGELQASPDAKDLGAVLRPRP